MITVLTAGHVNWDVTLRVECLPEADCEAALRSRRQSGGGSAANVAAALAGLEVSTCLIGSVGDDDHGRLARRELEAAGVDCAELREVADAPTTVKYLLVDDEGDVAVLGNDGVNEAVAPADVDPAVVRAADHVHLTSQRPDTAARIARIADDAEVPVSFDPGRRLDRRDYGRALARADVVFANDREAETVLEGETPGSDFGDRTVVVKRGDAGAAVHAPESSYVHSGFDVDCVDSTGAGDAFAAGFIATSLRTGDVERALEFANACGALAACREGARSAPTRDSARAFLADRN